MAAANYAAGDYSTKRLILSTPLRPDSEIDSSVIGFSIGIDEDIGSEIPKGLKSKPFLI